MGRPAYRSALLFSIPVYASVWIIARFTFEPFDSLAQYTGAISGTICIAASSATLAGRTGTSQAPHHSVARDPVFWFSVGVLIDMLVNVIYFLLSDLLVVLKPAQAANSLMIRWLLTILVNCCYTAAFLCPTRR